MDGARENDQFQNVSSNTSSVAKTEVCLEITEVVRFAKLAMKRFYENPNYAIYSTPQPPHHEQVKIVIGDRVACVDKGISEVIECLWQLDLDTLGSCECRPSGKAYVNLPVPLHADTLQKILLEHGIDSELNRKTRSVVDPSTHRAILIPGGDILFRVSDIPAVLAALRLCVVRSHMVAAAVGGDITESWVL